MKSVYLQWQRQALVSAICYRVTRESKKLFAGIFLLLMELQRSALIWHSVLIKGSSLGQELFKGKQLEQQSNLLSVHFISLFLESAQIYLKFSGWSDEFCSLWQRELGRRKQQVHLQ
jgi:hypothetical protein